MNDKNIDKLFRDKLDQYEHTPTPRVWENVNKSIAAGSFWYRHGKKLAAAALLLLLITGGVLILHDNKKTEDKPLAPEAPLTRTEPEQKDAEQFPGKTADIPKAVSGEKAPSAAPPVQKFVSGTKNGATKPQAYGFTEQNKQPVDKHSATLVTPEIPETVDNNPAIAALQQKSFYLLLNEYPGLLPPPAFEEKITPYLEQRSNMDFWAGTYASASMIYYPQSRDKLNYATGAEAAIKFGKFYIASGAAWEKQEEEGSYKINFKSYDSVGYYNKVVSFAVNPDNPGEITYKTVKATVYDSIAHVSVANPLFSHSYITVPLTVGYKFFDRNRFSAAIETGIVFSKLQSSRTPEVEFNNPDYQLISIIRETPSRSDINWQLRFALHLDYKLKKDFSLSLQPVFNKYLSNIYISNQAVKPYGMGIRFGFYYNF